MDSQANSSATTHGWRKKVLWAGLILPALLVVVLYGKGKLAGNKTNPDTPRAKAVLSARVDSGTIERTIRLTGATSPAKYANLVSPRMRGGGQHTNQGGSINTGAGQASSVSSASSSSSGSSSSSNSTSGGGSVIAAFTRATVQSGGGGSATTAPSGTSGAAASSGTGAVSSGGAGGGTGGGGGGGGRMFGGALVLRELANPGTRVKSGYIVAEFDREDMLTRVDDFKAQIVQAEASMRDLRAQLAVIEKAHAETISVSKATLDKADLDLNTIPVQPEITAEGLRLSAEEAGATHKQLLNEVQVMETSLQSQMRISELDLQETKAEFKRLQANADKMILRAPLDGIVVMRTTYRGGEQGQIMKGDQLFPGQSLMQIVDTSSMLVYSSVNQVDAEAMKIGEKATVRFDAFPDLELPATVRAIGAISTASGWRGSYVKQIPVTLKLDRLDPRVIPDLSVSADVVLGSEQAGVIAPIESVFQDESATKPFVFVRTPVGWERRDVELGLSNYVAVAVRTGVRAGEIVALERPVIVSTQ